MAAAATNLLLVAGVVFSALAIAGSASWRIRQSVIPAYLLAGVLLGPHAPTVAGVSLTLVRDSEFIQLFSELGVVLLLFFIGIEFSLGKLLAARRRLLRAGGIDLVVNLGLGLGLGFAFGFSLFESLVIAGVVYPSSSAVITKSLIDLGWIADPESETVLGVLVFEDVLMAIYLAVLAAVAFGGATASVVRSLGEAFGLLLAFVLLATAGAGLLERLLATRSDELFVLRTIGLTTLLSGVALAGGVSEAVAAFFVGAGVGETAHSERVSNVLAPARDLFAAVFFFAVGLGTDLGVVATVGGLLAAGVAVSIPGKLASGYLGGRGYRLNRRRSIRTALALVTRGEFSLVVVAVVAAAPPDVVAPAIRSFAVGYVLVMSILGTLLMRYSGPVERALGAAPPAVGVDEDVAG